MFIMNVLAWNCRGTCSRGFRPLIKDICKEYETSLLLLLETYASRESGQRIIPRLGLDSHFVQEGSGQSGGFWCLWNSDMWKIEVLHNNHQFVQLKVSFKKQSPWFLTVVYGSSKLQLQKALQEALIDIASSIRGPWAVIGDFNTMLMIEVVEVQTLLGRGTRFTGNDT